jgi:hypothetical protein
MGKSPWFREMKIHLPLAIPEKPHPTEISEIVSVGLRLLSCAWKRNELNDTTATAYASTGDKATTIRDFWQRPDFLMRMGKGSSCKAEEDEEY